MTEGRFDFTEYLEVLSTGYIERKSVEKAILGVVDGSSCGVCIVTGEPGSGKSAAAAAAVRAHGYLHYFLRRGHVDFSVWRDPYAFLATIGYQLWDRYGDDIFPPAVAIDINGKVHNVAEGGAVIGAEIERLVPLPWRSARIAVDLQARKIAGTAIGVRIHEVVEDYRFLTEETFREIAMLGPLRRLAQQQPGQKVVLWVDGLDEELEVVVSRAVGARTITSLVPNATEAREIGNLVVIVTSRSGRHLDSLRSSGAAVIELSEPRFGAENAATIATLVDRELADPAVLTALDAADWVKSELREEILTLSGDNFLYAEHFFIGVRSGEADSLRRDSLPRSLDELHARLITRIVDRADGSSASSLLSVIAVLAVAREPLCSDQIGVMAGIELLAVKETLAKLRPYLDVVEPDDANQQRRYALFHDTFRRTLTEASHVDETWHVDSDEANGMIAESYLRLEAAGWDGLDDYGRVYLTEHLLSGTFTHRRRLIGLAGEAWRRVRRIDSSTNRPFADDLSRAFTCLASDEPYEILPHAAKLSQMAARVDLAARDLPDGTIAVMARLGQHARASEHVVSGPTENWYINRAAEMIRGLAAAPAPDWPLIQEARSNALASMRDRPDHGSLSTLLEACPAGDDLSSKSFVGEAIEQFNQASPYWATPPALMHVARLLGAYDRDEAIRVCEHCLETIPQLSRSAVGLYRAELLHIWSDLDAEAALDAARELQWSLDHYSLRALVDVHFASPHVDRVTTVRQLLDDFDESGPGPADPYEGALLLLEFTKAEIAIGNHDLGRARLEAAVAVAETIGGPDDPERDLQNRFGMAADVWINAASVATDAGLDASGAVVERAWREATRPGGPHNGRTAVARLVRAQLARDAELLEARLSVVDSGRQRAAFLIAAADVIAEHDERSAAEFLEEAIELIEHETGQLGHEDELALAVAVRSGRAVGLTVLESADAQHFELDWRFALLQAQASDETTEMDWVLATVDAWSRRTDNSTLEHAAALAALPEQLVDHVAEGLDTLRSEMHRSILTGALSARVARLDRDRGKMMLKRACTGVEQTLQGEHRLRASELLAFFAGAWWHVDHEEAESMWREALLRATTNPGADPRQQSYELELAIQALSLCAPEAALAPVLCYQPPPPDPSVMTFTLAGPNTPPLIAAGMGKFDLLFGATLASAMRSSDFARARFEAIDDPGVASMTACLAALHNVGSALEERVQWCNTALERAQQVDKHHLRCLLYADAAEALLAIGLRSRALELAELTAHDIVEKGYAFGAILQEPAYSHALGRCLRTLSESLDFVGLARWVWEARILQSGLPRFLAYLPALLAGPQSDRSLTLLLQANDEAMRLFREI